MVAERARTSPEAIAIVANARRLTYGSYVRCAGGVAAALEARKVPSESVVAYVGTRGTEWAAAVLGILGHGAAYMPLDLSNPAPRIESMIATGRPAAVLVGPGVDEAHLTAVPPELRLAMSDLAPGPFEPRPVAAEQLSYVLFTSGSTGTPKGAMCTHRGLWNHIEGMAAILGMDRDSVLAQTAAMSFDISVWQLITPLFTGGRTVIVDAETVMDPPVLIALLNREGVTGVQLVPSYLAVLMSYIEQTGEDLPRLIWASSTGEELGINLLRRWFERFPHVPVLNAYGLAEVHDDTNVAVLTPEVLETLEVVPVGEALPNVETHIVDENLNPVAAGDVGQIAYTGICVGRGYVNDPVRTAERYVPDPRGGGGRMFLTGDFGRLGPDGSLEYRGRHDHLVKVRGHRIELGEVERRIREISGAQDVAAILIGPGSEDARLIAFYSGAPATLPVLEPLRRLLPPALIPSRVLACDELPRNASGKIDRLALARDPRLTRGESDDSRELPRVAEALASLWSELLPGAGNLGPSDDFFERGGTSLAAIRLVMAVGRALELRDVVSHSRLDRMATLLAEKGWEGAPTP